MTNQCEAQVPAAYPSVKLLISNEWIADRSACHQVIRINDESALGPAPGATEADLKRTVVAAHDGFEAWSPVAPALRSDLHHTAALVRERNEKIAPVITPEPGKARRESRAEIVLATSFIDWDTEQLLRT